MKFWAQGHIFVTESGIFQKSLVQEEYHIDHIDIISALGVRVEVNAYNDTMNPLPIRYYLQTSSSSIERSGVFEKNVHLTSNSEVADEMPRSNAAERGISSGSALFAKRKQTIRE